MFKQLGNIAIDDNFIRVDNRSYAINQISTVFTESYKPYGPVRPLLWGTFAIFFTAFTMLFAFSTIPPLSIIPGTIALWLLIRFFRSMKRTRQRTHQLIFSTSSGVVRAVRSTDEAAIEMMKKSVEEAITRLNASTRMPSA